MKKINSALVSVFSKEGLAPIVKALDQLGIDIYSTGGTQSYIESHGIEVHSVESLTSYPSILDGRVKTLHPKVFGGLLARREADHLGQLETYDIPEIDLVIVDLYPFEETVANTDDETQIIEKIDIGGISLIRAAAKNYKDVVVVPSKDQYENILEVLVEQQGMTTLEFRKKLALEAFKVSSHYDTAITNYFNSDFQDQILKVSFNEGISLRYGENPHQKGVFYGNLDDVVEKIAGKAISYNNLVDVDAAIHLMEEFKNDQPTFCILKHTNPCGVATRNDIFTAWEAALACDNVSAFGGILIANRTIDLTTAQAINEIFYEVIIAPDFDSDALELLQKKKKRIILKLKKYPNTTKVFKTLLSGVIEQDIDKTMIPAEDLKTATIASADQSTKEELLFALKCAKHLKSNTIAITKDKQLIGAGCGQTSRVDALKQAIVKARTFGFDTNNAVMASDAFFPFNDCVQIGHEAGIKAVIQPGGSIRDQESIDFCNEKNMIMLTTGIRHFKH